MTGVDPQDVENLLCFLYSGKIWIPKTELEGFCRAAKILRVDRVEPNPDVPIPSHMLFKPTNEKTNPLQVSCPKLFDIL